MSIQLVTGATGLLGGNLVRTLHAAGHQVRILVRKNSKTFHIDDLKDVEKIEGDITDAASLDSAFEGVDQVFHCAATVSMWPAMDQQMVAVNIDGTQNIIDATEKYKVNRLIHCSSVDGIGLPENGTTPSNENTPWNWDRLGHENGYARTKYESQQLVLEATKKGRIDAVIVNPTYMLGAYDPKPSSGQMILEVAAGKALGYTSGGNNFVDVEDVAEAMITAAAKGKTGEMYILGGKNMSYKEIFTLIAEVLGVAPPRFPIPYGAARCGGWFGDLHGAVTGKEPSINTTTVQMGYVNHYYDPSRAISQLEMKQSSVRGAIERAVQWFRQESYLPKES
jgi:dihydroflavonol-4-reductase